MLPTADKNELLGIVGPDNVGDSPSDQATSPAGRVAYDMGPDVMELDAPACPQSVVRQCLTIFHRLHPNNELDTPKSKSWEENTGNQGTCSSDQEARLEYNNDNMIEGSLICGQHASSIQDVGEVDKDIYNADEFESEKEDEDHGHQNEGRYNNEHVYGSKAIVYEDEEELSIKPHIGMTFDSEEEAYQYYNGYAYKKGFSVRRGPTRKSGKDNSVIGRRLVCSKEGIRSEKYKKDEANKKRH